MHRGELELIRDRRAARNPGSGEPVGTGSPSFIGRVTTAAGPDLAPGKFLTLQAQAVMGEEAEGSPVVFEDITGTALAYLVGPGTPATGDKLIASRVPYRWAVRRKGSTYTPPTGGPLMGCTCSTPPATLRMTVSSEGCSDGLLSSCVIQWGPVPSSLASLHLGANAYLSTELFTDTQTGDQFYYLMGCFASIFRISRVFPTSVFGSPFLDSVIYYWSVGLPGNTCSPFLLSNGQIYFGGDPSCLVTIDANP